MQNKENRKPKGLSTLGLASERGYTLVVKSNDLNEARYHMSLREQKLYLYMISLVNPNDNPTDIPVYTFYLSDVIRLLYSDDRSVFTHYADFKKILKGLHKVSLEFQTKEGGRESVSLRHLLEKVDIEKDTGKVKFTIPDDLCEHLFNLKSKYVQYKFQNISHLKSIYSVRIYELLKQYQTIGSRKFSINELRSVLKLEDKYLLFSELNRNVLVIAKKDVKAHTDIEFEYEKHKSGRSVVAITFYIKKNKDVIIEPIPEIDSPTLFDVSVVDVEAKVIEEGSMREIIELLINIGITEKSAKNLYQYAQKNCGDEDLLTLFKEKISIYQKQLKTNTIDNPIGFFKSALCEDYKDEALEQEKRKKEGIRIQKEKEQKRKELFKKKQSILNEAYAEEKLIIDIISMANSTLYQSFYEAYCTHRFVKPYKEKYEEMREHLEENYRDESKEFWLVFRKYVKETYPAPFENINHKYKPMIKNIDNRYELISSNK